MKWLSLSERVLYIICLLSFISLFVILSISSIQSVIHDFPTLNDWGFDNVASLFSVVGTVFGGIGAIGTLAVAILAFGSWRTQLAYQYEHQCLMDLRQTVSDLRKGVELLGLTLVRGESVIKDERVALEEVKASRLLLEEKLRGQVSALHRSAVSHGVALAAYNAIRPDLDIKRRVVAADNLVSDITGAASYTAEKLKSGAPFSLMYSASGGCKHIEVLKRVWETSLSETGGKEQEGEYRYFKEDIPSAFQYIDGVLSHVEASVKTHL